MDERPVPAPYWVPERLFEGETVVIVGGGPSLADMDPGELANHRFIAVNSACRHVAAFATDRDILYFADNSWSVRFPQLIAAWPGMVVTCNRHAKARLGEAVRFIDITAMTIALRAFPDYLQASSGHMVACLAAVMGASRLVLAGFDGRLVDGRSHGHADYVQDDLNAFRERFLPGWAGLAPIFRGLGIEVVNATPGSAIECFPFAPLAEAIR